jgi:hypothetical protein
MSNMDELRWHSFLTDAEQHEVTIFVRAEEEMRELGEYEVADLIKLRREQFLTETGHRRPVMPTPIVEAPAPIPPPMEVAEDFVWYIGPIPSRSSKSKMRRFPTRGFGSPLCEVYAEMRGGRMDGHWPSKQRGLRYVDFPKGERPPEPCIPPVIGEGYFF